MADIYTEPWRTDGSRGKSNQGSADTHNPSTRPKSRLGSYLATHRSNSSLEKLETQPFVRFVPRRGDHVYNPEPEQMITTMLTRLLGRPAEGLPPEHNSFLLHVFESYRNLQRNLEVVQQKLATETHAYQVLAAKFESIEVLWLEDTQTLVTEIRRLQSLLAHPGFTVPTSAFPGCNSLIEQTPAATWTLNERTAGGDIEAIWQKPYEGSMTAVGSTFAHCFSTGDSPLSNTIAQSWLSSPSEGTSQSHRSAERQQGTQSANGYKLAPSTTLSEDRKNRGISDLEVSLNNDTVSHAARNWSYTRANSQPYGGHRNVDGGLDMPYRISSWLADRTGTAPPA